MTRARPVAERFHIGRSWEGNELEAACPCPKEPCGLVDSGRTVAECTQHPGARAKTVRQSHMVENCPGPTNG